MDNKNNTQSLATPLAIIVAGFMIASAIYVSNSQSGFLKSKNATNSAGVVANANGGAGTDQNGQAIQPGEVPQPSPTPDPTVAPEEGGIYKVSIDDDPVLGDPNAPVTMIAFSDFRCPFCERFATDAFVKIKKDYVDTGKVKYILRDFSIHPPQSDDAALGAQCANEQGKFWEYHDMLFVKLTAGEDFSAVNLKKYAGTLGLNQSTFDSCLDGGKYKKLLNV